MLQDRSDSLKSVPRSVLAKFHNQNELWLPLGLFSLDVCAGVALFSGALFAGPTGLKILLGLLLGILVARLFVLGHDACHGSLTRSRLINDVVGRIAFLPSLTPFGPWALAHNQLHHAFTNVRGMDYVWAPLSYDDWVRSSKRRQVLERFYRTPLGHGSYYAIEIWFKHLMFPDIETRRRWKMSYQRDVLGIFAFATLAFASVFTVAHITGQNAILELVCAIIIPFLVWNALMGFVIYLHHTDPAIGWASSLAEQSQQADVTAHVAFPWILNALFYNIMDHPAHHIDPLIPLYRLSAAEAALVEAFPENVQLRRFTFSSFWRTVVECKLYDYDRQLWLDFEGRPSAMKRSSGEAISQAC